MTLDEMIQQCATDVDESPLSKSGGIYMGDALVKANKFISGINYAYWKIAREKYPIRYSETVTLDDKRSFLTTSLIKQPFIKIAYIEDADGNVIAWTEKLIDTVQCPNQQAGNQVTVKYSYLPSKLINLTDTPLFPESKVDHRILCYFGDFEFLNIETDDASGIKAQMYLALFNDGFDSISASSGSPVSMTMPTPVFKPYNPLE